MSIMWLCDVVDLVTYATVAVSLSCKLRQNGIRRRLRMVEESPSTHLSALQSNSSTSSTSFYNSNNMMFKLALFATLASIVAAQAGTGSVRPLGNMGFCLDVRGANFADGTVVQL
jgi:hypothetical protein